jgi:hypothetical protein
VYTIVLAAILLGETLSPIQVLGALLVIAGVILAETRPRGMAERAAEGSSAVPSAGVRATAGSIGQTGGRVPD